jgi:hypothetical protein
MWFTRQSYRKIARIYGLNYDELSVLGKHEFSTDCKSVAGMIIDDLKPPEYYFSVS